MNDLARKKLVEAALTGQRQIRGMYDDGKGGLCALGVLGYRNDINDTSELGIEYDMAVSAQCWICEKICLSEFGLVAHLNDIHELDFLTIARKMP